MNFVKWKNIIVNIEKYFFAGWEAREEEVGEWERGVNKKVRIGILEGGRDGG